MPTFPVPNGVFAGMTQAQLEAARVAAQTALVQLMAGGKGVSFSYGQGDGQKSVTYQATSVANLRAFIQELNMALGLYDRRRAIRPLFR